MYEKLRRIYYTWRVRRKAACYGRSLTVNYRSNVTTRTRLGASVNFNGMTVAGRGDVTIGSYFHCGVDCRIITSIHNYDHGSFIPYGPGEEDIHHEVHI